jgi:ubiquinone/menaquinone biosynthesis C-methylase UbiE
MTPERPTPSTSTSVRGVAAGYDEIAAFYDAWHWQRFWSLNEVPTILASARALAPWARVGLDIGAGTGKYLSCIEEAGLRGSAVDVSAGMLSILAHRRCSDASLFQCDAAAIPLAAGGVDVAFLCRVLSHVSEVEDVLHEVARVVRPGGILFITDVDSGHAYTHTRVPTPWGDVLIQTHKHSVSEIEALARCSRRWSTVSRKVFTYSDLAWRPSTREFPSIDVRGERAIFFSLALQRK